MEKDNLIQAYVHGTLNDLDTKAFEEKISVDSTLKKAVADYKKTHNAIKLAEKDVLKQRLKALNNTPKKQSVIKRLRPYLIPLAAASVFCVLYFGNIFTNSNSNLDLFNDYYNSYPNTLLPITRAAGISMEERAFVAYEAEEYKDASKLFKQILKVKKDADLKFYYGMSLLNAGERNKALPILNELKKDSTLYIPQTYWYAALIELKNDNKNRAKELIDSLQLLNADFKVEEAKALKEKLNN